MSRLPFTTLSSDLLGSDLLISGMPARRHLYTVLGKRCLDLLLAAILLPVALPIMVLLGLLIALDGGPPVFGHWRVGRGGEPFRCWKLRSMVPGAEAMMTGCLSRHDLSEEWNRCHKLRRDPRVTPLGRILRRCHLDELPQLWNILRGEMSLVGPRPVTAAELIRYGADAARLLGVRPGLTGPWQISGSLSYEERVRLDLAYVARPNLARDLSILMWTARTVVLRAGA